MDNVIYILAYLDKMYLQLANTNLTPISPFMTFPHPLPWPWRNVLTNLTFFDFTSSPPLPMEERIDQYLGTINAPLLTTKVPLSQYPGILYLLLISYNKSFLFYNMFQEYLKILTYEQNLTRRG